MPICPGRVCPEGLPPRSRYLQPQNRRLWQQANSKHVVGTKQGSDHCPPLESSCSPFHFCSLALALFFSLALVLGLGSPRPMLRLKHADKPRLLIAPGACTPAPQSASMTLSLACLLARGLRTSSPSPEACPSRSAQV